MRILSGIQPSGVLHIGNYFGMMRPAIELQKEGETFYFIADYHALTSVRNPEALRENSRQVALDFLACGLDPERAALFRQSDVPQVTELAWILSTVAPMGLLERAHSYKDKLARGLASTVGLFSYPVLMAADILIYDSDAVPVGKDQKQHIEITRDLAVKINETFGQVFKLPEPRINPDTQVVPGLDGQKMSKSRSEEHTSELQSLTNLVCRLLLQRQCSIFPYTTLFRSDILIYDSDAVPVGKDQKQHIEITRDLAVKINETFGQVFKLPEPRINPDTQVVPGLDGQKMSKSYGNNIDIFGDEKETRKRVMR